jgi:Raf kinase inhibitor-like YbhB/YbcL family protein
VKKTHSLLPALLLCFPLSVLAETFTLTSDDIAHGEFMDKKQEFNGFGCTGSDISPNFKWSNAPAGTKSFAITVYDPDAPTGSGWWHWQVVNIPVNVTKLSAGAGSAKENLLPKGSLQILNDYGVRGFGGACPPKGHGKHRYRFSVHALSVETLDLPESASGALTGYMINANKIESATIEAFFERN